MPSFRQLLGNPIQTHTAMLAGSFRINLDDSRPSSLSLERQRLNKLTPTRISNALVHARLSRLPIGKKLPRLILLGLAASRHIFHIQILNKHHIGFVEDVLCCFTMKLFSSPGNLLMQPSNLAIEQLSGSTSFFGLGNLLLQFGKLIFRFAKVLRNGFKFPFRVSQKLLQPQINPHTVIPAWSSRVSELWNALVIQTQGCIPPICFVRHRSGLDGESRWQGTVQDKLNRSQLGQRDAITHNTVRLDSGIRKRSVAMLGLKARSTTAIAIAVTFNKTVKRQLDSFHTILQNIGIDLLIPRSVLFELHQTPLLSVVLRIVSQLWQIAHQGTSVDITTVLFPPAKALCQQPVVLMPQHVQPSTQPGFLFGSG